MKRLVLVLLLVVSVFSVQSFAQEQKRFAYLVSDIRIPFWEIMSRGVKMQAESLGYSIDVYSAHNLRKQELENMASVLKSKYDGLILSPISSSTAVTILGIASNANIPVVISDIGTDGGDYVSYISSNNECGAHKLGIILTRKMKELKIEDGTVGIIAIPQKRANGKARTSGFLLALDEAGIKSSGMKQQVDFSYQETYGFAMELIKADPKLKALWLQGSDRYQGALDAIKDSGKEGEILLICFDAEPEFLEMIPQGKLVGAAMQQPFLMGEKAVEFLDAHLKGQEVVKEYQLSILAISATNIKKNMPLIKRNVLGQIKE